MTSALNTKINSYTLERGIEFSEAYTSTPTRTGTNPLGTFSAPTLKPSFISTDGPIGGAGSWEIVESPTAGAFSYFRGTTGASTELLGIADNDFTIGFWFKFTSLPTGTASGSGGNLIFDITSNVLSIKINGSGHATLPSRLTVAGSTTVGYTSSSAINVNQWYYIAVRRIGSGTNNYEVYLNGSLGGTFTFATTTGASSSDFGTTSTSVSGATFRFSNYHLSPSSVIDATAISEIYTVGITNPNTSIIATPITASALQTEPTIAVQAGDHIEVTTSIPVSADMPTNQVVSTTKNISNTVTIIDVSSTLQDQINILTGGDTSNSASTMTALADITIPLLPIASMNATAIMPSATVYVTPNYYSMIKSLNPYLYFYDGKATSTNGGYQSGTFAKGTDTTSLSNGGNPLNIVGEGKSWLVGTANNGQHYIQFTAPTTGESFGTNIGSGNYAIEMWVKFTDDNNGSHAMGVRTDQLFSSNELLIQRINRHIWNGSSYITYANTLQLVIPTSSTNIITLNTTIESMDKDNWHHIVVQGELSGGKLSVEGWVDGQLNIYVSNQTFTSWTPASNVATRFGGIGYWSNSNGNTTGLTSTYLDEWALYDSKLSNSIIIAHKNFISTLSPDAATYVQPFIADASSGNNQYVVNSNVNYPQISANASATAPNSTNIAGKSINIISSTITASVLMNSATIKYGVNNVVTSATSYAESTNAFRLSDIYYNYVQTNIAPYRYVTFDGNDSYLDYGTDNDYSVVPVTVGGTIVNPDLGINGKSAKTAGTSYSTDGVILKESEWNDTWGTDGTDYHSSFWIQRAIDDQSTTGLRIIQSAYGPATGTYGVLYQYQNKLHFELSNGTSRATFTTTNNIDLFDYLRHMVLVNFHTQGLNVIITVYVDAVAVLTIDVPHAQGILQNSLTYLPPNEESSNMNRFAVGALIAPFGNTQLPVQPTNTKLIVDEIIWAKTQATQTLVTNLFNTMPIRGVAKIFADPFIASDELVYPTIITNSRIYALPLSSNATIVNAISSADREVIINESIIDVVAEMRPAKSTENRLITADIFIASAYTADAVVKITIPGGPMIATAKFVQQVYPTIHISNYMKYIVNSSLLYQQALREVK